METYQTFYHSSSSAPPPPAAASSLLSLNMMNSSHHHANYGNDDHQFQQQGNNNNNNNNNNNKINGFLGIMSEMEVSNTSISQLQTMNRFGDHGETDNNNDTAAAVVSRLGTNSKKGDKKIRKPRYAFQTRSQVDILDDGYRWRKYGQKAVKNNKFPRSYYRCTHLGCNVKKQVQRLTKDEGVVVTTYEGMHSHPIEKSTDNFEHILTQMQIYTSF